MSFFKTAIAVFYIDVVNSAAAASRDFLRPVRNGLDFSVASIRLGAGCLSVGKTGVNIGGCFDTIFEV